MFGIVIEFCDLMLFSDKGLVYYCWFIFWGKWLEMFCFFKMVFVVKWCRCDYLDMEGICEILIVLMKIIYIFYFDRNIMIILFFNRYFNGRL